MMSLVQRAKEGNLPLHQNIDMVTLQWIKNNKPLELKGVNFLSLANDIDLENLSRFAPSISWFTSPTRFNSLHGVRHLLRVITYSWLLSKNINQILRDSLFVAAALHDVRRLDDRGDQEHADRAAKWYIKNRSEVLNAFRLNEVNDEIVTKLIKMHGQDYNGLMSNLFYLEFRELVDILKTSDALDRYIQPKKKWWLDDKYLNLKPSLDLKAFAFKLIVMSEEKYLEGISSEKAVLSSLKELRN